jgi:alkanesulfonate monooxygenase SsuD/methylene tetrahydromethanopterin reductase-like flavin-dependent oxidoreductase (luciferase family)
VVTTSPVEFGYNPPPGDRGLERVSERTWADDMERVLDVAVPLLDSVWVPDHLMMGSRLRMECWTQLTWIAARYARPMIGTMVMADANRHPPLVAKMAATLQLYSRGRFVLGYGAGWNDAEYHAYGYDVPDGAGRVERMVEGIRLIRALWTEPVVTFEGRHYRVREAYLEPKPQPVPPIMIGGEGERLVLRAVAEHADWWNARHRPLPGLKHKLSVRRAPCEDVGRDVASIRKTCSMTVFLAEKTADARAWAGSALDGDAPPFAGNPAELRATISELVDLGFSLFQLAFPAFPETHDIERFAAEVAPAFR